MKKNKGLLYDARCILERDPAARNLAEVILLYPGFHAIVYHRLAQFYYRCGLKFLARWTSQWCRWVTGIEIHPGAQIGSGLFIDHGMGVVIGETTVIGDDCTIYHGVTLGGTGKEHGKRHPTIGNNVLIGAGARVLGPFTVGDNARIGAGAVVLDEVPEGATVAGTKARTVKQHKKTDAMEKPAQDLDQVHIADPVAQDICLLLGRIENLEKQLAEMSDREK